MTDPTPSSTPDSLANQPSLDLANFVEIARWLAEILASGIVGNMAYDALKNLRSRYGARRVNDLKARVLDEMRRVKRKPGVSDADLQLRVDRLFADHETP